MNPEPRSDGAPLEKITPQDLWNAAVVEHERSAISRDALLRQAAESDQRSEAGRAELRSAAAAHGRRVAVFEKIANLIRRAFDDAEILARLREIDAEERRVAAEDSEPEADAADA
jgi:hypothetical protein